MAKLIININEDDNAKYAIVKDDDETYVYGTGITHLQAWEHAFISLHYDYDLQLSEIIRQQQEIERLRVISAYAYSGSALYTDDGELQDGRLPMIDWKRDSIEELDRKLFIRKNETMKHFIENNPDYFK